MAIIVNTNVTALKTQNNLNKATNSLNQALQRMSTGLKINSAADDAAGLFVATKLETQIRGSKVAQSNVATGINVLQTFEGNLDVINDNMLRIRDLCVQAANGVYDTNSITAMQNEITARVAEITRIQDAANFNGINLFSSKDIVLQVGANSAVAANSITITGGTTFKKIDIATGTGKIDITTAAKASASIAYVDGYLTDTADTSVAARKATIGAVINRLNSAQDSLTTTIENASAAKSTIMDADIAEESANYTKNQILQQTSATLLVQANNLPSLALTLIQ